MRPYISTRILCIWNHLFDLVKSAHTTFLMFNDYFMYLLFILFTFIPIFACINIYDKLWLFLYPPDSLFMILYYYIYIYMCVCVYVSVVTLLSLKCYVMGFYDFKKIKSPLEKNSSI